MVEQLNAIARLWWEWSVAMFWQVGLLILLIAAIDRLVRRWAWPQLRYALWSLILIKLILPPSLSLPSGIVPELQPVVQRALARLEPEKPDAAEGHVPFFLSEDMLSVRSVPVRAYEEAYHVADDRSGAPAAAPKETPYGVTTNESPLLAWQVYAMMASLLGTLILGIWLFFRLHSLVGRNAQVTAAASLPESFYNQLAGCARRLELHSIPRVVVTRRLATPAVFGVFRPVLLMPKGYLGKLSRRDTEHMLLHELAHIKRGDLIAHSLYMLLQIVYWYNPLLWLVRRQMHHLRELSCDATVAEVLRERTTAYRQTLLETARRLLTSSVEPGLGLLGLFEDSNRLLVRLDWLTKPTWRYRTMKRVTVVVIAALMLACVLPMARAQEAASNEESLQVVREQDVQTSLEIAALRARLAELMAQQQQLQEQLRTLAEKRSQAAAKDKPKPVTPPIVVVPGERNASSDRTITVVPGQGNEPADEQQRAPRGAEAKRAQAEQLRAIAELERAQLDANRALIESQRAQAKQMEKWAQSEQMQQWQADIEKWQNSEEMKQWQQKMEQWGQEMERRYEQGEGADSVDAPTISEPKPMPPMPPMPALPPVTDVPDTVDVAPAMPHVSVMPQPQPRARATFRSTPRHEVLPDLPDGDRVIDVQLPERLKLVDLLDLAGRHLNLNYIYDPEKVTGDVTLKLNGRLTGTMRAKDLYKLLQAVLELRDLAMVRVDDNIVKIVPKAEDPSVPHALAMPPVAAPTPVPVPLQEDMEVNVQVPAPEAPAEVPEIPGPPPTAAVPHEQLQHMGAQMQKLQEQMKTLGEQRQHLIELQVQRVNEQLKEQQKDLEKHRVLLREQRGRLREQQEGLLKSARDLPAWGDDDGLEEATATQNVTAALSPHEVLDVVNEFGSITVRGGEGDTVRIVATVKGRAETMEEAQAIVDQAELDVKRTEGKLCVSMTKVEEQQKQEKIVRRVDFELIVPRNARIRVSQSFGDARLSDLDGSVQAATNMGSVRAVAVSGKVALAANFGNIDFVAAPDLSAKVQATAQFGSIESELPLQVVTPGEFSMGSQASGILGDGEGKISLTTNMGSIRIQRELVPPEGEVF